jgi:hypothetical protein
MVNTLVTLLLCAGEVVASPSTPEIFTPSGGKLTTVIAVTSDRTRMLMEGEMLTLTKTGENLFQFDDKQDIPGGKTSRVVGTIDFGYGRLIYEAFGYIHLPLDSQPMPIPMIVRRKTNLLCQERQ